jgi:hypothetical protein
MPNVTRDRWRWQPQPSKARAARGAIESALGPDVRRWPWSRRLSLWLDALVVLEEVRDAWA